MEFPENLSCKIDSKSAAGSGLPLRFQSATAASSGPVGLSRRGMFRPTPVTGGPAVHVVFRVGSWQETEFCGSDRASWRRFCSAGSFYRCRRSAV